MLEALEDYVKRQKKRFGLVQANPIKSGIEKAKSNLANDE
jgi:hypothetical protein